MFVRISTNSLKFLQITQKDFRMEKKKEKWWKSNKKEQIKIQSIYCK